MLSMIDCQRKALKNWKCSSSNMSNSRATCDVSATFIYEPVFIVVLGASTRPHGASLRTLERACFPKHYTELPLAVGQ